MHLWERQPGDTKASYTAFLAYLELGPKRSLRNAYRVFTEQPDAPEASSHWRRWSAAQNWVERAEAYDTHELEERMATRDQLRERVRQQLLDRADELMEKALDIALGEHTVQPQGERVDNAVVAMLRDLLDRVGVCRPDPKHQVELGGSGPATITLQIGGAPTGSEP